MRACDTDNKGYINYIQFCNFLNWKDKLPTGIELITEPPVAHHADETEDQITQHTEPLPTERSDSKKVSKYSYYKINLLIP